MNKIICLRKISDFKVRIKTKNSQNPTRFFITLLNPKCSVPVANSKVTKELISSNSTPLLRKRAMPHTHFFHPSFQKKRKQNIQNWSTWRFFSRAKICNQHFHSSLWPFINVFFFPSHCIEEIIMATICVRNKKSRCFIENTSSLLFLFVKRKLRSFLSSHKSWVIKSLLKSSQ